MELFKPNVIYKKNNINNWFYEYEFHINKLYDIFISNCYKIDKKMIDINNYNQLFDNFVYFLYKNSYFYEIKNIESNRYEYNGNTFDEFYSKYSNKIYNIHLKLSEYSKNAYISVYDNCKSSFELLVFVFNNTSILHHFKNKKNTATQNISYELYETNENMYITDDMDDIDEIIYDKNEYIIKNKK